MAPDRRRRGSSISRRRRDPRADYNEPPRMRTTPQPSYSSSPSSPSSSSSNSIVDISHSFPPKRSGIRTFFTAPSERKLRKRRSSRLMKNNNSSSSSVNSDRDLAYGHGYIKRPKLRRIRSRSGRDIDRERYGESYNKRRHERQSDRHSGSEGGKIRHNERARESTGSGSASAQGKLGTTAEILAVGAGLRAIASEQNRRELREARNGKKPELATVRGNSGQSYVDSRGIGTSRVSHGPDEDGWESASDSESSVDSKLAFGNDTSGGWGIFGRKKYKPMSRKSSVVDPRLFGPANSLRGVVTRPVGFGDVSWTSTSDFGDQREADQRESYSVGTQQSRSSSMSQVPLQQLPPMPMSEVGKPPRYTSEPQLYTPIRPEAVPIQIQHPKPFTPVSQSVYEPLYPTRSESGGILKKTSSSSGRGQSLAKIAVAGVAAAAAIGSMSYSARDDRKYRQREGEIEALEKDRISRHDSEKREPKDEGRRDKRSSPPRDDRKDKRRDKDKEEAEKRRRDMKGDHRRGETIDEKVERREKRREERRAADRADDRFASRRTKSEASVSTTSVDPFQFQVDQNAFPTPITEFSSGDKRIDSAPKVVTVEREPDFSRKRSSPIKNQASAPVSEPWNEPPGSQKGYSDWNEHGQSYRGVYESRREHSDRDKEGQQPHRSGEIRDQVLHDAKASVQETKHFTGPYDASVVTAVVAAEHHRETRAEERRRERQKNANYDDYTSTPRDKTPARDPIQEEADRAYREIVMARKIASQVIRSRSPSPDASVVRKYQNRNQEQEVIRIITPPVMEGYKGKGPYDAPNADFRLDHVLEHPRDLQSFNAPSFSLDRSNTQPAFLVRDADASKPRPLLNLVRPTPTPSPMPEKQVARSEPGRKNNSKDREPPKPSSSSDVVIGPKGNVIASPTASAVSKGVTWGQNETKHYEVESPSEHRDEFVCNADVKSRDSPADPGVPKGGKGRGAVAAGIISAGVGATAMSEISKSSKPQENEMRVPFEYRGVVVEPENPLRREDYRGVVIEPESPPRKQRQRSPPSPGPKPIISQSSHSTHMPGAFDDDLDFTATVAAGLEDTGFDPNIVIDDPTFRRRDSPPGSNDRKFYQTPFAETVTDLGTNPSEISKTRGTEGFVIGEVASTPIDWPVVLPPENDESYSKLSKKEQKKLDKAVKRQSDASTPLEEPIVSREVIAEPDSYFAEPLSKKDQKKRDKVAKRQGSQADGVTPLSDPSASAEIIQEPESYFQAPKKSKKSKGSSTYDDIVRDSPRERTVSVPVNAYDDLQNGQDVWAASYKKSKKKSERDSDRYESPARSAAKSTSELERSGSKKSKRDSDRYESPTRSAPSSEISSSGKKSKDKSSRRSGQLDCDPTEVALPRSGAMSEISSVSKKSKDKSSRRSEQYEYDPTEVSLPPSTPSETSRDGDFDDSRSTRRSSTRDSGIFNSEDRGDSRSVVSASTPRDDKPEPRKKKKSRSGASAYDDTRSVASAPAGDDYNEKKGKKKDKKSGGIFSGLFGSKSESGARDESPKGSKEDVQDVKKKSKKSKRSSVPDSSSIYGDTGSVSVNDLSRSAIIGHSHGNGSYAYDDGNDDGVRSDGEKRKKSRSRSESTSSKKDSFLGKAGTLGAGVGTAGVTVAAIAAQHHQQSKAETANSNAAVEQTVSRGSGRLLGRVETLDLEITQRQFRPSIDPQYGDLLPLPPSDPTSPNVEPLDDLPKLPDSRPNTPESERLAREKVRNAVRRNVQDTPMKFPSQSQVPLKFKMGGTRSMPSSPGVGRPSSLPPPANPSQESLGFQRHRSRPTSWDNSKEFKPLYLVESARRGSNAQLHADDELLPELPPSQRTSRSYSQLEDSEKVYSDTKDRGFGLLSIDTTVASAPRSTEFLGSGQSTAKANTPRGLEDILETSKLAELYPVTRITRPPKEEKGSESFGKDAAKDDCASGEPSGEPRPYPVDPVAKDRSSYLLRSSPMPKQLDDFYFTDRSGGSPNSKPKSSSDRDAIHSIREREIGDAGVSKQPHDVNEDREKTLERLSGSNDNPTQQLSDELGEPSGEPDAPSLQDAILPNKPEPSEEVFSSKSKKSKKKSKLAAWDDGTQTVAQQVSEPSLQTNRDELVSDISDADQGSVVKAALETSAQVGDFSTPKSKKGKKDKKKKSAFAWELEAIETQPEVNEEPLPESDRLLSDAPISREIQQADLEPLVQATAEFAAHLPEVSEQKLLLGSDFQEPVSELQSIEEKASASYHVKEDIPTSTTQSIADAVLDEFSSSKKKGKKDKRKSKSACDWDEPGNGQSLQQAQEPLPDITLESVPTPTEPDTADASLSLMPKKDNKNDKRKGKTTSWEPQEETTLTPDPGQAETTGDASGENIDDVAQFDDFSTPKSKGKKSKKSKLASWESELDTPVATESPIPAAENRDLPDHVSTPSEESQPNNDFSSKSKNEKKRRKKGNNSSSAWDAENEKFSQVPSASVSEAGLDLQAPSTPLEEPFKEFKKKDRKKDKKKSKSVLPWEPESNDAETQADPEPSKDDKDDKLVLTEASPAVEESLPAIVKFLEKELESSATRIPHDSPRDLEQDSPKAAAPSLPEFRVANNHALSLLESNKPVPEIAAQEQQPQILDDTSAHDEFVSTESKNAKKKESKSIMDEVESSIPEPSRELQVETDQFPIPGTPPVDDLEAKNGKGTKNETVSACDQVEEIALMQNPVEIEEPVFTTPSSKKDKKKGKKSQQWDEPETGQGQQLPITENDKNFETETFDDYTVSSTKKGKKKSRKPQQFDDEKPRSADASKSLDVENILPLPETPLSKPTPLGGPGGWPITPATPLTGGEQPSGEVPSSTSKGYFPAPVGAVGAAIFGSTSSRDDPSSRTKEASMAEAGSTSIGADALETESKPTPDGLASDNGEDQLSLAGQLQEDFGKRSSKKEKKKRQSLPSTPAVLPSRSRTIGEDNEGHIRARSLSIGPAADRSGCSTATSERKNTYSEDHLELARQLKADFESGSKKSKNKKGKKGRATPGDEPFEKDFDGAQTSRFKEIGGPAAVSVAEEKTTPIANPDALEPDGFAAGYQEDQLSLARQLQADFAKKASKKDRKRRNTSQTPVEQAPPNDDFGDRSHFPGSEPLSLEDVSAQSLAIVDKNLPVRDGLAVGYNAEQLELARQLKEEFGSGSKKKGKEKMEKKRGSPLRSNTEDDDSSGLMSGDIDAHQIFENPEPDAAATLDAAEEFAAVGKKSKNKKDKKGKRGVLPSTPDIDSPTKPASEEQGQSQEESSHRTGLGDELLAKPASTEPEDEFAPVSKKDKKSKKGKKRGIVLLDDEPSQSSKPVDALPRASEELPSGTQLFDTPSAEAEDDSAFCTEISKKERQSSPAADDFLDQPIEYARSLPIQDSPIDDAIELADEPGDEFGYPSKKKDKKKKRGSLLRNESFNDTAEKKSGDHRFVPELEIQRETISSPVVDKPQDDFEYSSSKKTKKDKKKRGSLLRNESFNAFAEEQAEGSAAQSMPDNLHSDADLVQAVLLTPLGEEKEDFEFTSKKSKKKRGSLPPSPKVESIPEPQSQHPVQLNPETPTIGAIVSEPAASIPECNNQEDEFAFKSKKSGKDKKIKHKSTQPTFDTQDSLKAFDESPSRKLDLGDTNASSEAQDPVSVGQPSSEPAVLAEEIALNHPVSRANDETPEAVLEHIASAKKSKKMDKKLKDSTKTDAQDIVGVPAPLDPFSEPNFFDESALPTNASFGSQEDQGVKTSTAPGTDEPVDDWDNFSAKKSKKKRKDASKPDLEGILTPSEPILEPSKDVALTPLPLDQTVEDSVLPDAPMDRELEPTTTVSSQYDVEEPTDEWNSFSIDKPKSKKVKKKTGSSKTESERLSGSATPIEKLPEPSQPIPAFPQNEIATETSGIEQPRTQASDDLTPTAKEDSGEPADDWGSFSTKKSKKGKKYKKSGPSTPIEQALAPITFDASTDGQDMSKFTTSQELKDPEDDWDKYSSKKSKKAGKSRKSGLSTPIEEALALVPERSSLDDSQDPSLAAKTVPGISEQGAEYSKETREGPTAVDDTTAIPEPSDELGSVSAKKSRGKNKKQSSGLPTSFEEPLPPVPEQLGTERIDQSSTPNDLDLDATQKDTQRADTLAAAEEQGNEWGDFTSNKSKKNKDKKQKNPSVSPPSEGVPCSEKYLPEISHTDQQAISILVPEATESVEKSLEAKDGSEDQGDDVWASLSAKPCKKDRKKQKLGISTSVEATSIPSLEGQTFETSQPSNVPAADIALQSEQPVDEEIKKVAENQGDGWGSFSVKPSENGKNNKSKRSSGLSTPIEQTAAPVEEQHSLESDPPATQPVTLDKEAAEQIKQIEQIEQPVYTDTKEVIEVQGDVGVAVPVKQSKNQGKKNRKSGLSTPVNESLPPGELEPDSSDTMQQATDMLEGLDQTAEAINEQEEWVSAPKSKKGKKDKRKNRQSGVSTPTTSLPSVQPGISSEQVQDFDAVLNNESREDTTNIGDFDTGIKDLPAHTEEHKDQAPQSSTLEDTDLQDNQLEGNASAFLPKKSKNSKEDKRNSCLPTPVEEVQVLEKETAQQPLDDDFDYVPKKLKNKKDKKASRASSESGPSTPTQKQLPTSLEDETLLTPFNDVDRVSSPMFLELKSEEQDLFTSDLSRKSSKKDKRKRQPKFDITSEGKGPSTAPSTCWADNVVEAEVARDVPVIQEIAKVSQIATTVESTNSDDFTSKEGKKEMRKISVSAPSTPVADTFQQTGSRDLSKETSSTESSHTPAIIATGAAITAAAILGEAVTAKIGTTPGVGTPTKKLSKKDKKKKSIDRRAPREDDIFDDPALWEGADPKVHEESKEGDDESGFWSPPQRQEEPAATQEVAREASTKEDQPSTILPTETIQQISPTSTHRKASPVPETPHSSSHDIEHFRDLPGPSRQLNDLIDEFVVSSSEKKDEKKTRSTPETWDTETSRDRDVIQPASQSSIFDSPTIVETAGDRGASFNQPPTGREHISTPPTDLSEQNRGNIDALPQESSQDIQPRLQSRYFHSRLADLPIVHEEILTQLDSNDHSNTDSAFGTGSPIPPQHGSSNHQEHVRDSGEHLRDFSPAEKVRAPTKSSDDDALARLSWPAVGEGSETVGLHRSQRSKETKHHIGERPSAGSHDSKRPKGETAVDFYQAQGSTPTKHHDEEIASRDLLPSLRNREDTHTDIHQAPTEHGPRKTKGQSLVQQRLQQFQHPESPDYPRTPGPKFSSSWSSEKLKFEITKDDSYSGSSTRSVERSKGPKPKDDDNHSDLPVPRSLGRSQDEYSETPPKFERPKEAKYHELTSSPRPKAKRPKGISEIEAGAVVPGASLEFAAASKLGPEQRPASAQSQRSTSYPSINRLRTPDIKRPDSVTSNRSGTPPLRRSDRKSGDLRSLSQRSKSDLAKEVELASSATPSSALNTANPTANEGRVRAKDMADVYDGFGEGRMGSPRSPTRPHSMRRRQSMQVLDLEQKLEQLAAENRMLADAKAQADRALHSSQTPPSALVEKDAEIDSLKRTLEWLQNEVTRLSEVNDGLTSANITIARQHGDQYGVLESQHTQTARELREARDAHENLSASMEGIVRNEVQNAVLDKDREIAQLRAELDAAKEQIRKMQRQILASKANDVEFLTIRDEDYFDNACQQLCQHVQQWVLRFSKFSDMRACRLTSEINNDKTIDRLDNAILDGSDVDNYLADRVKRRDVFMSMTMTMVWEFIFTRYLFGMDREQRQKLKSLEKLLSEVGPAAAVHHWRATTLTLLAKREAFRSQREQDTQAVVHAVLETLSEILPPPSQLETQIEEQLSRVMKAAVDLSIEMRCQRAEYMMLPPLQPEYDANGDLASKVAFNAALMNERSGDTVSNEELEGQKAVVRIVLFPLVVKKGDDTGEGDEEIVVCPAQVLVAKPKKSVRALAPEGNNSRISMQSSMPAGDSVV